MVEGELVQAGNEKIEKSKRENWTTPHFCPLPRLNRSWKSEVDEKLHERFVTHWILKKAYTNVLDSMFVPAPHPNTNLSAEALTLSVATFGDGASKDITKVKWGRKGGVLLPQDQCSYEKRQQKVSSLSPCVCKEEAMGVHSKMVPPTNQGKGPKHKTYHISSTLILDLSAYRIVVYVTQPVTTWAE